MLVKGFKAAAVEAGFKYKNRLDLGIITADAPVAWAGVFTQSVCRAAPVIWSSAMAAKGRGRAFLANAGQANAQTGPAGTKDCYRSATALATLLSCPATEIMLASTGVIGQPINISILEAKLPNLLSQLRPDGLNDFAQAILTTDTRPKIRTEKIKLNGHTVSIWGCAKGSGMIAPNLATMLGFLITDAEIKAPLLRNILVEGAEMSFNRVTIDGDTSTNDSLMIMASGAAGMNPADSGEALAKFKEASFTVMKNLAYQITRDGEGATRLITIRMRGAKNTEEAKLAARTVAESPLVKTAFFGGDANWGRLIMALGRSGATFDPYAIDIDLDDIPWVRQGQDNNKEKAASMVMKKTEYGLLINLNAGNGEYEMLTCDFSPKYIAINASYRS
ncbi:MAG: bifunctional glutamate N-acetyltransferase/amino-acid acetyltransferase ArgJ [Candidatus Adiutrix intracellularis]|jgi:glutamate N-acetyltransferase/amino-acid N-acetyltransferase|nr:bifunctional glutamate N-acetyltransferase/amino-acid acetyltransferase ArgJ [Candidatus Adiutrix intracellularis]